jgi:hypothetical protein
MSARRAAAMIVACGLLVAGAASAQSAQPWSVQASFLAGSQKIGNSAISGIGVEAQFRYTPAAAWSVGVGFQYTTHPSGGDTINISGVFLEPRYTIDVGSNRVAPYVAGRIAFLHESLTLESFPSSDFSSGGFAIGAGAGLLIRASRIVNIDIGAAFVNQSFSDASAGGQTATFDAFWAYVAKAGVSIGFGSR